MEDLRSPRRRCASVEISARTSRRPRWTRCGGTCSSSPSRTAGGSWRSGRTDTRNSGTSWRGSLRPTSARQVGLRCISARVVSGRLWRFPQCGRRGPKRFRSRSWSHEARRHPGGIVYIEGTNCEEESVAFFRHLGAQAEKVHLKQLTGDVPPTMKRTLDDFDLLMIPGGFAAGDYVRAGAIFAARLRSKLSRELKEYV